MPSAFPLWIGLSDIEKVLNACGKHGVAVEIWRWHQAALGFGCMMSINPDAHSIPELDHMHWGVEMARKGGVPSNRVLNAMALPQITRHLGDKRKRPAGRLTADLHRPRADED